MALKFSVQKRFILILLLIVFLVLTFSIKAWSEKLNFSEIKNKISQVLAQEEFISTYFFPHLPQRLVNLLSEIENLNQELVEKNEKLNKILEKSDCSLETFSQCLRPSFNACVGGKTFSVPPENRGERELLKEEIADRIDNLSLLRELLKKEIESGLEDELKTLREEDAEKLKSNLEKVLDQSQEIINKAKETQDLYDPDYTKCSASCQSGPVLGIDACVQLESGPQKHININAKVEIGLKDLDLGEVKIEKFNLALPEKLKFPISGDLVINIPTQTVNICFPTKPIHISVDPPHFTSLPTLEFGCSSFSSPSASYQSEQKVGEENETVETQAGTNWYFETLSWLMEQCANLPTMKDILGLPKEKLKNCYQPDTLVTTINEECDSLWKDFCSPPSPFSPTLPNICKKIRVGCGDLKVVNNKPVITPLNGGLAASLQCQDLFKEEGLATPPECLHIPFPSVNVPSVNVPSVNSYCSDPEYPINYKNKFCLHKNFNPIQILKNKCQELKNKYSKEPPEPCKILPLFTGQIEGASQETYSGSPITYPSQKLTNFPLGFGMGKGFNCAISAPSLPKIPLPDIVIPDIHLPNFKIPPFLEVKLPNFIFEDLILPDIELCDFNQCSFVFPDLRLELPRLKLPSFDASIRVPQIPGLSLRSRVDIPSLKFSLPQINLFNVSLPELTLPKIPFPSPKFSFKITGIDLTAIFEFIVSFIGNAKEIPEISKCLKFGIPSKFLSITYPDRYFSFKKYIPEIPKIPFCEDVNKFCKNIKDALGKNGWLNKAREIEKEFNNKTRKIQEEIDKTSKIAKEIENQMNEVLDEYGKLIGKEVIKELTKKGYSLEDFMNLETKEIDLNKLPFPGVFPVVGPKEECLSISLPSHQIIFRMVSQENLPQNLHQKQIEGKTVYIEKKQNQTIIYSAIDLPLEIPIDWPDNLKKIQFNCDESGYNQCRENVKEECNRKCAGKNEDRCNFKYLKCQSHCQTENYLKCSKKYPGCLSYNLPTLPLSCLNYEKDIPIKTVGFQSFEFDIDLKDEGVCSAQPALGGNPFPINDIADKISEMKNIKSEIDNASQVVIDILE